ncbi:MAG: hypothetical protein WA720_17345, partial [Pseudolabrys sp.]
RYDRQKEKEDQGRVAVNIVTAFDSPAAISESLLAGHKVNVCPLWVISGYFAVKLLCPLYPQKRTCAVQLGMSPLCQ